MVGVEVVDESIPLETPLDYLLLFDPLQWLRDPGFSFPTLAFLDVASALHLVRL